MSGGDLCSSPFCGDLALPAQDLCAGCIADRQAERQQMADDVRELTERQDELILTQEESFQT